MIKTNFPDYFYLNKDRYFNKIPDYKWNNWKWQYKNSINKNNLTEFDEIKNLKPLIDANNTNFNMTPYIFSLINFTDFDNDPIANQIIPQNLEFHDNKNNPTDPFNEQNKLLMHGVIQRFNDRVLILSTNLCPVYCRYCTRKWNWLEKSSFDINDISNFTNIVKYNKNIREVIISGGEPFFMNEHNLEVLIKSILKIKQIEVVRIATRILTFLPQRITKSIVKMLKKYDPIWIVTHFNHSNEITPATEHAIDMLLSAKVAIANQTVLLKDINDNSNKLMSLNNYLQRLLIKPYYLFQCDNIKGTDHFKVNKEQGIKIYKELQNITGGLSLPNYVEDNPVEGKIIIG